ncbi:MAG: thiamine-phosphate kinase, partial [Rhodanobacter sp.]
DLSRIGCGVTRIGRIVEGSGVRVRAADGEWLSSESPGWEHFA